ncbi:hypothetical protein GOP47_0010098 [Adiantum capillus-veneris]|uniref:Uncharacterized protein n=1 Tax=Adiantum capillus-veneris TaxID=13818 RepID=A0A9D4ZHG2_ADICA|nr:hypothetical protein GOP47_0010098 [Adiantum capillus-veneris]
MMAGSLIRKLRKAACCALDSLLSLAAGSSPTTHPLYEPLHSSNYMKHDEQLQLAGRRSLSSISSCSSEEEAQVMSHEDEECMNMKIPKGFLPVLLGPNYRTCYVIRTALLAHPLLAQLLELSAREFGYAEYRGALKLPCDAHHFEELLGAIAKSSTTTAAAPPLKLTLPLVYSISHLDPLS